MRTKPDEFIKFNKLLMASAPEEYVPWYFPVVKNNKAPDGIAVKKRGNTGSWKAEWARLSYEEALQRLKQGGNIGLSARKEDPLVILDIDDYNYKDFMPDTLVVKSRKRVGWHGFCFTKDKKAKINIPTDYGEVRASEQYVVATGSFCTTSSNDINKEPISDKLKEEIKKDKLLGVYTVDKEKKPLWITYGDLPEFYRKQAEKVKEKPVMKSKPINSNSKRSALFDLNINDIVVTVPGRREPHPLHSSDTGMNFSVLNGLAHCWRHLVSLNAIQFLVVKSGYMGCLEAGSGHSGSGAGCSSVINDDGAIFHAWIEAKKSCLIPHDDPIPTKAMVYIAKKYNLIGSNFDGMLPIDIFNIVLDILESDY